MSSFASRASMIMKKSTNAVRKVREGGEKKKDVSARRTRIASTSNSNLLQCRASVHTVDDMYLEPVKRILKPTNQLHLSEEELGEEITHVLTTNDPNGACVALDFHAE